MYLRVNQDYINNGEVQSPRSCPIALALQKQLPLPPGYHWQVQRTALQIWQDAENSWNHNLTEVIPLPLRARRFIDAFDKFEIVQPITIRL